MNFLFTGVVVAKLHTLEVKLALVQTRQSYEAQLDKLDKSTFKRYIVIYACSQIKNVEHRVYDDEEEFSQYCPNQKAKRNWREGTEGNWVLTDDGQVCEILKRGNLNKSQSSGVSKEYVRTAIGTFVCKDSEVMEGELRKNMYSIG